MGWIISTCILGGLLTVAILIIIVMFVIASRRIREIEQLENEKNEIINEANAEIDKGNKLIDKAKAGIGKGNKLIERKNILINFWIKYAGNLRAKRDSTKNELDEANKTIKELNIKLERTNEIIDRLSNSNMNAPQPKMERADMAHSYDENQ